MLKTKKSSAITCFGEIMLRLTPAVLHERIEQTELLKMGFAGAESNIATSLAKLGNDVAFVTLLPSNSLGDAAENLLRKFGVNTASIQRSDKRIGTYFIENGASIRPSSVIYDRENSAIAALKTGELNWGEIFKDTRYFVLTGITPALSDDCAAASLEAVKIAKSMGVKVCFDFNYRSKLWSKEKAREVLHQFIPLIDILFTNEGSAFDILSIDMSEEKAKGLSDRELIQALVNRIAETGSYQCIAITHRGHHSASHNSWAGFLSHQGRLYESKNFDLDIVDRLGGGDAFAAGFLHALAKDWSPQKAIDFATVASAIKHTIPGDLNIVSEEEILYVLESDSSGRILR